MASAHTLTKGTLPLLSLLLLLFITSVAESFYIPGLSPNVFYDNERVPLFVNKISSKKSPLPYAYADLPFVCDKPKDAKRAWLNLGEVLRGDRISTSNYEVPWSNNAVSSTRTRPSSLEDFLLIPHLPSLARGWTGHCLQNPLHQDRLC